MKRREFLNITLPATGAVMLAPGFLNFQLYQEIGRQFTGEPGFREYDLVVNGAGLSGYFAAIAAAQKGYRVLIVDKRTSPGYDIAAKRKLWIGNQGFEGFDRELTTLFFPEQEKPEIQRPGGTGPNNSRFGEELLLLAGSVKKGLLRNLLVNRVHVLLMTDVCGVFADNKNVTGVMLASKHGLYSVRCKNFIDATDNLIFSREITGQKYQFTKAGYVIEVLNSAITARKTIQVPESLGVLDNRITLYPGKNSDKQGFLEFAYNAEGIGSDKLEYKSRVIAAQIGRNLRKLDSTLSNASIHWYGLESTLYIDQTGLPSANLNGYYMLQSSDEALTCSRILEMRSASVMMVDKLYRGKSRKEPDHLIVAGARIPIRQVSFSDAEEPGLSIPLQKCSFPAEKFIRQESYQVVVAGGGTAGGVAGIAAQERGAQTVMVEYFNDLGGTRTMGGVMGYYHGMKENRLLKKLDEDANAYLSGMNISRKIGQKLFLLDRFISAGGVHITGSMICGSVVNNNKVEGILCSRDGKLQIIKGQVTIDATGDGDVAAFAGAVCHHGNPRTGKTQNYSQWNIAGGGKPPSNVSSDYDIIDNTRISELQRGLFLSHYEAHFYDFHPYLTVRESRRVEGLYTVTFIDASEATHFEDVMSLATSDYDPHYVGNSEFTRCGFLLPHSNILKVEIPYRAIVPKNLDGLLVAGKAISQTHDALQYTRMTADIIVLGFLAGQVAAHLAIEGVRPKDFNIAPLQKEWFELGYIAEEYAGKKPGNLLNDNAEISRRVSGLATGKQEFLFECCKLPKEKVLPLLKESFARTSHPEGKLLTAKALAWFGDSIGAKLVEDELNAMFDEELRTGYPGGYVENYDFIRGREKNILEGLFWRINQNIALLGMSGHAGSVATIRRILENTTSGGDVIYWTGDRGDYFNARNDLRIIPFYNRIMNLSFYAERLPDPTLIPAFEKLLADKNISGFITSEYHATRWRIYGGNLELYLGAAMARCGSEKGYDILVNYLDDIHYNFKAFAVKELKDLTRTDFNFNSKGWKSHVGNMTFPAPVARLEKEIDV